MCSMLNTQQMTDNQLVAAAAATAVGVGGGSAGASDDDDGWYRYIQIYSTQFPRNRFDVRHSV